MKKRIIATILIITLLAVLFAFTGCMKYGMTEHNLTDRLKENGYRVSTGNSLIEYTDPSLKGVQVTNSLLGDKTENDVYYFVYVYYCKDTSSADKVEEVMNGAIDGIKAENPDRKYSVYRYENMVLAGDFDSVTAARNF